MEEDGRDNAAKIPAIQNNQDDEMSSGKNSFQPSLRRRKRSESESKNTNKNSEDDDKPPACKRKRDASGASSEESADNNLPYASSIDEYLQSPHNYAPRPEWCHPTNYSPSASAASEEFAAIASTQNAAAADQAAAARMDAVAAFESILPAGFLRNNVQGGNVNNANDNDDGNDANDEDGDNNLEAVDNVRAEFANAVQEVANNVNENVAGIPLAEVARNVNAQNREPNPNRERRHHHHHHRRRRAIQGDAGGAQQQLQNAIGNIQAVAQRLRRDIVNVPGLSAQQRDILRGIMGRTGQRRAAGQPGQLGQVDIPAIDQVLRAAPRQAGAVGVVGGQNPAPLNLQALNAMQLLLLRRQQQQPVLEPQLPVQQQQQQELQPFHQLQQQPLQLPPHNQLGQLLVPNQIMNAAGDNPLDETNRTGEGTGDTSNANEANNVPAPGKISVFGNDLDTLLHLAIKRGAIDAALDLIDGGACIDFPNAKGITPLMVSSQEGNIAIVRALLNKGAKPNKTTIRGSTALIQACHFGRLNVVEELLKHGALIEQANYKNTTALMRASQEGHEDVVKILLQHNAVVNRRNDERMTALMLCSQRGHSGIVKMLIKAGAEIDARTSQASTSLMLACKRKNLEVAKILVAAGTELKLRDGKNRTVLETATRRGNADFARILTDDAQLRLIKEEARRERNFCMIRLWHLLNWKRATIRAHPKFMTVHELTEDLDNPILQQLCPSKRALVRAMTMPAPVIELITAFIPLPLCWEKRLSLLSSRSHVDPDTAVYNTLDLLDEVIEEGGILEAFDSAGMTPPTSFDNWTDFRGWCGRCDVILSRCENEDTNNIFALDASGNSTPRHVESAQIQRRRENYLHVLSRAPNALADVLASSPYEMPPVLVERLKANGDLQSLTRRLTSGVHFESSVVNEMIVLARMAVMWCESRRFY